MIGGDLAIVLDTGAGSPTRINGYAADDAGGGSPTTIASFDAPLDIDTGAGSPYATSMTDFQIIASVATSRTVVILYFSEAVDTVTGGDISNWDIGRISVLGNKVTLTSVHVDGVTATFTVYPDLSPGMVYEISQTGVESVEGDTCVTDSIQFTTSRAYISTTLLSVLGPADALWQTLGRQLSILNGSPVTYLSEPWTPGDSVLMVIGTHRFPESGSIAIGGFRFTYIERRSGSLHGIIPGVTTLERIPAGTRVSLDERSLPVVPSSETMS